MKADWGEPFIKLKNIILSERSVENRRIGKKCFIDQFLEKVGLALLQFIKRLFSFFDAPKFLLCIPIGHPIDGGGVVGGKSE